VPIYEAYGLRIDSAFELPELSPSTSGSIADITFRKQRIESANPSDRVSDALPPDQIGIRYAGIVSLLIKDGTTVDVDVQPGIDPRIIRLILLGPVLGLMLHQRSFLVLHASAVEIGSSAVAFIGEKGAGKSTTAAAFNAEGYALLADDIVAVAPETHLVYPGFPQLKLFREAAKHLTAGSENLHRLHPDLDKVGLRVANRFAHSPRPLRRVFALTDGPDLEIQSLPPQQSFMELVKHSYALSFLQSTNSSETHFRQAVALASRAPVCRLIRPRSLPLLSNLVAAVVANAA
jgi:hypothetical protein